MEHVIITLKKISKARRNISRNHAKTLTHAFVTSHLDYGNSLRYGINKNLTNKLQLVQNAAARVIDQKLKYDHITESKKNLHWLPEEVRSQFKIRVLTWKALNDMAPNYLKKLIIKREITNNNVRNNSKSLLKVPKRSKYSRLGDRAFQNAAPKLWNELPDTIKGSETLSLFKKRLKTYMFNQCYT